MSGVAMELSFVWFIRGKEEEKSLTVNSKGWGSTQKSKTKVCVHGCSLVFKFSATRYIFKLGFSLWESQLVRPVAKLIGNRLECMGLMLIID